MTGALGGNWTRIAAAAIFAGVVAAIFWVSGGAAAGINLVRVRFGGDLTETRVVLDLDRSVTGRVTADGSTDNMIVVSLPNIDANSDLNGRGHFTTNISGENFSGEATRVAGSAREGLANGAGTRGSYINCRYTMNSPALGTGSCRLSNGAVFTMHVGG